MRPKTYHVLLSAEQRLELTAFCHSYRYSERERKRAQVLLLTDEAQEGGQSASAPHSEGLQSIVYLA